MTPPRNGSSGRLVGDELVAPSTSTRFEYRTRFDGLTAIAERDEVFLSLRYSF